MTVWMSPQVSPTWATMAWDKGDFAQGPRTTTRQALAMQEKYGPESIDLTESYDNLGKLARQKGDGALAETQFRKALAVKEKMTPGSLSVAGTLSNLGEVFRDRGDLNKAEDYDRRALAIQEKLAPGSIAEAQTLYALASIQFRRGQKDQAIALFEAGRQCFGKPKAAIWKRRRGAAFGLRCHNTADTHIADYIAVLLTQPTT